MGLPENDIEGDLVDEFTRALETAFGAGPFEATGVTVDRLDGRAATGFGGNDPVRPSVSPCRSDRPATVGLCLTAASAVPTGECLCAIERPEWVPAIRG